MRTIQLNNATFTARSAWSEIPAELLLRITPCLYLPDRNAARSALIPIITDIPPLLLLQLAPWQFAALLPLADWLWDEPLTTPLIPTIHHADRTWSLPAKDLLDPTFTFLAWSHLDGFLSDFAAGDPDALTSLYATLLSPENPWTFNPHTLADHAATLASLPLPIQLYLLHLATGSARHIRTEYAILWEPDEDTTTDPAHNDYTFAATTDDTDFGWVGAAYATAENHAFGTFNQVMQTDAHTILYYLSWKKQEARRAFRQMKAAQKNNT